MLEVDTGRYRIISILIFLIPVSEAFGSYILKAGIPLSLPNLINLTLFSLAGVDFMVNKRLPVSVMIILSFSVLLLSVAMYHDLIPEGPDSKVYFTSYIGTIVLMLGLSYWLSTGDYLLSLQQGFIVLGVLLIASIVLFQFFDFVLQGL